MAVKRTYKLTRQDVNSPWPDLDEWEMNFEKIFELQDNHQVADRVYVSDDLLTYYHERFFANKEIMDDYFDWIKNHPDFQKCVDAEQKYYQEHNMIEEILFDYDVDYNFDS